ncbi:MAG: AAA family ATPase [Bacteroidetes bacterium]|nr:MAG: AAA family ATPase [Bacteroidota bacterium]
MIERNISDQLLSAAKKYPVITLTGPRQSGKTTCCRLTFPNLPYSSLEEPDNREFAISDPRGFLEQFKNGGIIDEIQRVPELTSYLQGIVDNPQFTGLFVLTGSQNFSVRNTISQSLAGRSAIFTLLPFSYKEVETFIPNFTDIDLIFNGFYPRLYDKKIEPNRFYSDYINTYVERDLRSLSLIKDLTTFQIFLKLCAGRTGQILNIQNIANDTGISQATAKDWISLLEASYIIFRLPPFFKNIGKRLIKSPKIYFYDPGLAAFLIDINDPGQIDTHPLKGNLYETMILSELVKNRFNQGRINNLLFYRDSNGTEVDVLIPIGNSYTAIEIKASKTITNSFFKGLKKFESLQQETVKKILIHSGDIIKKQSGIQVTNLRSLGKYIKEEN